MNCAYHTQNTAVVNCNGCGKPLCSACDHRIKGFPFCQDCIVLGVELLRQRQNTGNTRHPKKQSSPFVAAVLSLLCPGLGAAYNGQTSKALIHFAVFVGLFQMAILTGGMAIFVLGFFGMWLFAALDALRTARLLRSGANPDVAEDAFIQTFSSNPKLWGIVLTALGLSFFLQMFFNFRYLMRGILPVLLIGLGIYLLRDYVFKKENKNESKPDFTDRINDSGVVSRLSDTSFRTGEYDAVDEMPTQIRKKNWKNG